MTNPNPLSPAAQAIADAFEKAWCLSDADPFECYIEPVGAALRAAAYQVAPARPVLDSCCEHFEQAIRHKLLTIAAELEGE